MGHLLHLLLLPHLRYRRRRRACLPYRLLPPGIPTGPPAPAPPHAPATARCLHAPKVTRGRTLTVTAVPHCSAACLPPRKSRLGPPLSLPACTLHLIPHIPHLHCLWFLPAALLRLPYLAHPALPPAYDWFFLCLCRGLRAFYWHLHLLVHAYYTPLLRTCYTWHHTACYACYRSMPAIPAPHRACLHTACLLCGIYCWFRTCPAACLDYAALLP